MSDKKIGIQEFISAVVKELRDKPTDRDAMFFVEQVELEIAFTVERNLTGGLDLQVVNLGADKKTTDVQTVRIALLPLAAKGEKRQAGWDSGGDEGDGDWIEEDEAEEE